MMPCSAQLYRNASNLTPLQAWQTQPICPRTGCPNSTKPAGNGSTSIDSFPDEKMRRINISTTYDCLDWQTSCAALHFATWRSWDGQLYPFCKPCESVLLHSWYHNL